MGEGRCRVAVTEFQRESEVSDILQGKYNCFPPGRHWLSKQDACHVIPVYPSTESPTATPPYCTAMPPTLDPPQETAVQATHTLMGPQVSGYECKTCMSSPLIIEKGKYIVALSPSGLISHLQKQTP